MRRRLWLVILLPVLGACSAGSGTTLGTGPVPSHDELSEARSVARQEIADNGIVLDSADVIARPGRVSASESNTGHACTSGRLLQVQLIGDFPHTQTTGHPVLPGQPVPDFTVRAMGITVDAASGQACLIGVRTGENGPVSPPEGSTPLDVD